MSDTTIRIDGRDYEGLMMCNPLEEEPTPEELKSMLEASGAENTGFLTDLVYYVPDDRKLCHALLTLSPKLVSTFPLQEKMTARIGDAAGARVLKLEKRANERELAKIDIEADTPELAKEIRKFLSERKIDEGEKTQLKFLQYYDGVMSRLSTEKGLMIDYSFVDHKDDPKEVELKIKAKLIPGEVDLKEVPWGEDASPDRAAIRAKELEALKSEINRILGGDKKKLAELVSGKLSLPVELKESEIVRNMSFTPIIDSCAIEDGKLLISVAGRSLPKRIVAFWDEGFARYISTRSPEEKAEALAYLTEIEKSLSGLENMSAIHHTTSKLVEKAKTGWMNMEKSYALEFKLGVESLGLVVTAKRTPLPRRITVAGDFPRENSEWVKEIMSRTIGKGGFVDMDAAKKAMDEIYEKFTKDGYRIKDLNYTVDNEGLLKLNFSLSRWDDIYSVRVMGEKLGKEQTDKNSRILAEVMKKFIGKFIREEDVAAIKRMLARGLKRSDVQDIIATDPRTGKTQAFFVASESEMKFFMGGGGGVGGAGININGVFRIVDDGKGTSFGVKYNNLSKWEFFKSSKVEDILHHSLGLQVATPIGPNQKIEVAVYGSMASLGDESMKKLGADVTHRTFFLNDKLNIALGGAIELVDAPKSADGFTKAPVRAKPHADICYKDDGLSVCLDSSFTAGATNYHSSGIHVSYSLPLGKGNVPYIVFSGSGGFQLGNVPEMEQETQLSTRLPFAFSVLGGDIHYGTRYAGASVALGYNVLSWLAVKPFVASLMMVGSHAKATVGGGVAIGPLEILVGYRMGLRNSKSGLDLSIGAAEGTEVPEQIRHFFEQLFLQDKVLP